MRPRLIRTAEAYPLDLPESPRSALRSLLWCAALVGLMGAFFWIAGRFQ